MKYFWLSLLMIIAAFSAKASFVEGLEDIPLPSKLTQMENANLNFGNEEIRFVETYFESKELSFVDVGIFYKETMPQLGWTLKKTSPSHLFFGRGGETLAIPRESDTPLIIRLTVKSKN